MKLCDDTVTIYNAKRNTAADTDVYSRTVISGVSWYGGMKSTVDDSGLKAANQFTIRIPVAAYAQGKSYVDPITYAALSNVSAYFTLSAGDLIVRGVGGADLRPAAIRKTYPDVTTILAVIDNRRTSRAPHWKVVGT